MQVMWFFVDWSQLERLGSPAEVVSHLNEAGWDQSWLRGVEETYGLGDSAMLYHEVGCALERAVVQLDKAVGQYIEHGPFRLFTGDFMSGDSSHKPIDDYGFCEAKAEAVFASASPNSTKSISENFDKVDLLQLRLALEKTSFSDLDIISSDIKSCFVDYLQSFRELISAASKEQLGLLGLAG